MMIAGRKKRLNRYMWEKHKGAIPGGMYVLHHCDDPHCINPEHLFLGTQKDNIRDMDKKGRRNALKGEKHGRAKLSEAEARAIKQRCIKGRGPYDTGNAVELSRKYNVSRRQVLLIASGRSWAHV